MKTLIRNLITLLPGLVLVLSMAGETNAATGTWIVEFEQPPAARWLADQGMTVHEVDADLLQLYRNDLAAAHDAFLEKLAATGIPAEVTGVMAPDFDGIEHRIDYRYTLVLNGIALQMDAAHLAVVAGMDGVKAVHENEELTLMLDWSVDYVRAPEVYGEFAELTPFDDFREGFEGQGIIASIIDTGIDWSHEMFGADVSPPRHGLQPPAAVLSNNQKIIYYLSFLENEVPIDDHGHGTHVASTVGGYLGFGSEHFLLDERAMHGMAPQARLMGYKVCSGPRSAVASLTGVNPAACGVVALAMAIEDSVSPRTLTGFPKPVAHVINMSIGGAGGPDSALSIAADNAVLAGTIFVSSAGNSGPGKATVGQPAAARHAIAVGANNDPGKWPHSVVALPDPVAGDPGDLKFAANFATDSNAGLPMTGPVTARYVDAGLADTPDQVPLEVLGNICLVERGSTIDGGAAGTGLFANKAANCEAKGAIATVLFNNEPGPIDAGILAPATRPFVGISREAGLLLRDELGFRADGLSNHPISVTPPNPDLFAPVMAGFSSRGPVQGMGQIKPDVTAPGVSVLAATVPTGLPVVSMQSETRYTRASGTSMSGPHVAGAAALVKQSRLSWSPDLVRTALINTATNLRDEDGAPKPDGLGADDILSQGGGLIDVFRAINTRALMGVAGDGINAPGLLGSHAFGAVPVVNSRVTHAESVDVTLRDVVGEGGNWQLSVVNNRDLQIDGIDVELSADSVSVMPGGSAGFTVSLVFDGDKLRAPVPMVDSRTGQTVSEFDTQWYVIATRDDGEYIHMPFHLRPVSSVPAGAAPAAPTLDPIAGDFVGADGMPVSFDGSFVLSWTGSPDALGYEILRGEGGGIEEVFSGTLPASDQNLQLVEGVSFMDFPIEVPESTIRLQGDLVFPQIIDGNFPDLDLFLINPDGNTVAASENPGGPEHISMFIAEPGIYTWRVTGWASVDTDFELTSVQELGAGEVIGETNGGTTSLVLTDQPEGLNTYQVRMLTEGRIGFFVTLPGNAESILVDRREQVEITESVSSAISNVSFTGNVFAFDLRLTNQAEETFVPLVEFNVIGINSNSGTVHAINADNGGSGTSADDPALYDYSHQLGADDEFGPGETTGPRRLEFQNDAAELFTFDAVVTAYVRTGEGGAGESASAGSGDTGSTGGGDGDAPESESSVLRFEVNPLTGEVTVTLIGLIDDVKGIL